jgi:hypothetical protein
VNQLILRPTDTGDRRMEKIEQFGRAFAPTLGVAWRPGFSEACRRMPESWDAIECEAHIKRMLGKAQAERRVTA